MSGWGKGLVWVNGFNLGWYWPLLGPQMTMYVPGPLLKASGNEVVLLEFAQEASDLSGEAVAWVWEDAACFLRLLSRDVLQG